MHGLDKSMKKEEEKIRAKFMDIKDWKIKSGPERRIHYEKQRKGSKDAKSEGTKHSVLYDTTGDITNALSVRQHMTTSKSIQRQTTRFSRIFSKNKLQGKGSQITEATPASIRKDERIQLKELVFDKMYMNRVLWDEHVRMLFLRSGKISQSALKNKPHLRLWMEALMHRISQKSQNLRLVLRGEINFLKSRHQVQRQLHFWQTLHSLTLDQLYHRKRQMAFKKRKRYDSVYEQLEFLWKWYNKGDYSKVIKVSQNLLTIVGRWLEENPHSAKFKILCDLNYVKGLALMHLEKYDAAFSCFRKDGDIGTFANLKASQNRAKDNFGRIQAIKGNFKLARKLWTKRVQEVTEPKEKAWFYYNIAQCLALEENYEKAIEMVNKSIGSAEKCKSFCWELNGNLLLANCAALLGMSKESNSRVNTLTSLKAINRAYQCAVYLANVSVIKKIMDIVVHIYNSFKDIDLSMLEEVWTVNLLEFARKAATMESEKAPERKNMNLNNPAQVLTNQNTKKIIEMKMDVPKAQLQISNCKRYPKILKTSNISKKNEITVHVCNDELELHPALTSGEIKLENTRHSNFSCRSPITAVEVITSDEVVEKESDDEWITDSEDDSELQ